jgi:hypothetical protein
MRTGCDQGYRREEEGTGETGSSLRISRQVTRAEEGSGEEDAGKRQGVVVSSLVPLYHAPLRADGPQLLTSNVQNMGKVTGSHFQD